MNSSTPIILQAKWVAPMDRPILRDAGVLISSKLILAIDSSVNLRRAHPHAKVFDLPNCILLPGLINAHVHLELSDCTTGEPASADGNNPPRESISHDEHNASPPTDFAQWLIRMLQRTRITPEEMDAKVSRAIAIGVDQCHRFGVTTVGDISRQVHLSRPLLRNANLRVVSFGEIMAMAQRRGLLEERLALATDAQIGCRVSGLGSRAQEDAQSQYPKPETRNPKPDSSRLTIGLSPHSPYSVEIDAYQRCVHLARQLGLPIATHLAETPHEAPFLANHTGPLRDLWEAWLTWDDHVPTFIGGPIRMAKSVGLLDCPSLLAHVNYCDDAEMDLLASGCASVVYCPRTHAYFGHPPHRWLEMLSRGINVAIGTDSCASSPDLNLVDDLRLLRKIAPTFPADQIWQMATTRAAHAIRLSQSIGSLTPGKFADVVAFEAASDDPLEELLHESCPPCATWIDGQKLVKSEI